MARHGRGTLRPWTAIAPIGNGKGEEPLTDDGYDSVRQAWRGTAADLSAEFNVRVTWCPLGFEVPGPDGITHVASADAVRTILGGKP
jgi:hypothetical protein